LGAVIQILNEPFSTQYSQAFYWAVMVTVGVGKDINPQSETETNFTIFVIGIGIVAYALLIGNLSAAIQSMATKSRAHNKQMERVTAFMQFNKVPPYMQIAVKQFYDFKWSRKDTDIQEVIHDLPDILKVRLKVLLNREILSSVPVFRDLPADCLVSLTQHIRSSTIFPGERSIHQGRKDNTNIFIIRHGRMHLTRKPLTTAKKRWRVMMSKWRTKSKKAIHASLADMSFTAYRDMFLLAAEEKRSKEQFVGELKRGNFYGINSLVPNLEENFSVTAVVFTEVIVLETASDAMQVVLREFPDMKKKLVSFAKERHARIQQSTEKTESMLERKRSAAGDTSSSTSSSSMLGDKGGGRGGDSGGGVGGKEEEDTSTEIDRRESLFSHARGSKYSVEKAEALGALTESDDTAESADVRQVPSSSPPPPLEKPGAPPAVATGQAQRQDRSDSTGLSPLEIRMTGLEEQIEEIRAAQDVQFRALNEKLGAVLDRLKRLG
jgi:CRP-like cAMP-binding protein